MADLVENGVVDEVSQEEVDTQEEVKSEATTEKTYTQAEVTEMIQQNVNRAVAKAHKDAEEQFQNKQDERRSTSLTSVNRTLLTVKQKSHAES